MADAAVFDWVCSRLEQDTSLDRLESRGTVRLALKSAGLEARSVPPEQMKVVVEKVLGDELSRRGITSAEGVCSRMASSLAQVGPSLAADSTNETPDAVFTRLGGGR